MRHFVQQVNGQLVITIDGTDYPLSSVSKINDGSNESSNTENNGSTPLYTPGTDLTSEQETLLASRFTSIIEDIFASDSFLVLSEFESRFNLNNSSVM